MQQRAITLDFAAKKDHYQSNEFVCVSVIMGLINADNLADAVDRLIVTFGVDSAYGHISLETLAI